MPGFSKAPSSSDRRGQQTELFLQSVLDSLEDRVNIVDRDYRIMYANAALVASCAKPREEIIGKKCYKTYWGNECPCEVCVTPATFQTGRPQQTAHWEKGANGGERYIEHYTYPIIDNGKTKYVIECLRDATERKSHERKMREGTLELGRRLKELRQSYKERELLQEQLIHAERMASIGQMASSMAHELDTPLSTVSGYCELLSETVQEKTDRAKIKAIAEQVARCQKIIRNALDYARRPVSKPGPTDVNQLIVNTMALVDYALKTARVKVTTRLAPDLPEFSVDAEKLQQVFLNLLRNACDAMPQGGEVHVTSEKRGDMVHVRFRDTGHGIAKEHMRKIFDPFFTTKEQGRGTGLGLSICRSIVNDFGGQITARNEKGSGAEFHIQLPITR